MGKRLNRVVLDTNVIVSALIFSGNPAKIFSLALDKQFLTYSSNTLLAELQEVLIKKFAFSQEKIKDTEKKLKKFFKIVHPKQTIEIVRDTSDNRVLEIALEANCDYIITGDKDLLDIGKFKQIIIINPEQFLRLKGN